MQGSFSVAQPVIDQVLSRLPTVFSHISIETNNALRALEAVASTSGPKARVHSFTNPYICWTVTTTEWRDPEDASSRKANQKPDYKGFSEFTFDKRVLGKSSETISLQAQMIIPRLRRDGRTLQKLRHPAILSMTQTFAEDKSSLCYRTRSVNGTLADLWSNLRPLSIKLGVLSLIDALAFLHQGASLAHLALSPFSIFVDGKGDWKLGFFGHCIEVIDNQTMTCVDFTISGPRWGRDAELSYSSHPPSAFIAPEIATETSERRAGAPSDLFSLGVIIYGTWLAGESNMRGIQCGSGSCPAQLSNEKLNRLSRAQLVLRLSQADEIPLCQPLRDLILQLLDPDPSRRPLASTLINHPAFFDADVRAVRFLESLHEKDDNSKVQFLETFANVLESNPMFHDPYLIRRKLLPELILNLAGAATNEKLDQIPGTLKCVIIVLKKIAHEITEAGLYEKDIWPYIRQLLSSPRVQVATIAVIVNNLDFVTGLSTEADCIQHWIPFILKCLSISHSEIQRSTLHCLPSVAKQLDAETVRNVILKKIIEISTSQLYSTGVRSMGIEAIAELHSYFDRSALTETLIPALNEVIRIDQMPQIANGVCRVLDIILRHFNPRTSVKLILPILGNILCMDPMLPSIFTTALRLSRNALDSLEQERKRDFHLAQENASEVVDTIGDLAELIERKNLPRDSQLLTGIENKDSQPDPSISKSLVVSSPDLILTINDHPVSPIREISLVTNSVGHGRKDSKTHSGRYGKPRNADEVALEGLFGRIEPKDGVAWSGLPEGVDYSAECSDLLVSDQRTCSAQDVIRDLFHPENTSLEL